MGVRPMVSKRGEACAHAKLTESDIPVIRARYRAGENRLEIASDYPVTPRAITHIIAGRTWKHVPDPLGPIVLHGQPGSPFPKWGVLPQEKRDKILALADLGMNDVQIARVVGVATSCVHRYRTGGKRTGYRKVVRGFDRLETALRALTEIAEIELLGQTFFQHGEGLSRKRAAVENARVLLDDIENLKRMP